VPGLVPGILFGDDGRDSNGQSGGLPRTLPENMSVTYLSGGLGKSMFLLPARRIPLSPPRSNPAILR